MTNPPNAPQSGAPQPGVPQSGAPQSGVPQPGVPQYAYPQTGAGQFAGAPNTVPQYGFPPQGPGGQPVNQPPKKRRKWPWILGALVVLIVIIAAVSGGGSDSDSSSNSTSAGSSQQGAEQKNAGAEKDSGAAGLNTPVRDGKFEFVVTGVEKGLSSVGDNPYLTEQAQGQFVVVSMTVQNTSKEPQSFSPSDQKLVDDQGRSFEPSTSAQIALGGSDIPVWDNINPGNTVDAKVVFDMPKDATPTTIELHDSMFSGGVKVRLN
ncbi:DUF4352 domain-containing protein [Gordonia jacobaea]|uniref:DUF4352 domain-containing protein n=1 Tax=Gordonia jacobaea TaxID=122202 RepID=UPI0022E6EA22|nr:DUF4352 domain-containing protein [Gordonia jacobaea]